MSAAEPARVTAVRFWSMGDVTRIAIEATGQFDFHSDHLPNPDRLFFDLPGTKPDLERRGVNVIPVHDRYLKQIRVAETQHGVTRIVLDLASSSSFTTETLANPDRLIIELRTPGGTAKAPVQESATAERAMAPPPVTRTARVFTPPPPAPARRAPDPVVGTPDIDEPPAVATTATARPNSALIAKLNVPPPPAARIRTQDLAPETKPEGKSETTSPPLRASAVAPAPDTAYPARRTTASGDRSMTRVLGLKVSRIVIDAGHGGHDTGTIGPTGLREKDLVLDVSMRLGALIEERMGSQVIYTRSDDTFIPLEQRTAIANDNHADLFLSIHANSSQVRAASGVETYYLSFTTSKDALDLATRENAESSMTVNDLQDLLQKIALKDKVDESREFAERIQTALCAASTRTAHNRDRGIRKAPFVVLIGATMPSVLAEIGFVSNAQDERLLKRPETRQKLAEALYKGLSQYAATLSHFQVAETKTPAASAH
ncbi:MAG: N-acetylmuramoyl-L-alanine amidase [Bryobacteraceae bacterium]|jgi:N-acetylmuramoyl-L-alanine amidase